MSMHKLVNHALTSGQIASRLTQQGVVLHVGSGPYNPNKLHETFRSEAWREIRLDIDPRVKPDIVASLTDMEAVPTASVDAVWSSHNLEHLYAHQVPLALEEFLRVLNGHRRSVARGNSFMAHRTGFTATTLRDALTRAGFVDIKVRRSGFDLWAKATKRP
jgi:hypothetical protein